MREVVLLLGLVAQDASTPATAPRHRRVPCGDGVDAVVIDRDPPQCEAPESEALALAAAQAAILSAYAAADDVLPVALGAAFSGDAALARHLAASAPRIAADRAALAGTAEFVVAIDAAGAGPLAPDTGAAGYLRRKQAERALCRGRDTALRNFVAEVIAALGAAGASLAAPRAPQGESLLTVSALLQRDSVAGTAAVLAALAPEARRLGLHLRMIGPCAPFSFVHREPTDG